MTAQQERELKLLNKFRMSEGKLPLVRLPTVDEPNPPTFNPETVVRVPTPILKAEAPEKLEPAQTLVTKLEPPTKTVVVEIVQTVAKIQAEIKPAETVKVKLTEIEQAELLRGLLYDGFGIYWNGW